MILRAHRSRSKYNFAVKYRIEPNDPMFVTLVLIDFLEAQNSQRASLGSRPAK
jgi:hypothetical protein